MTDYKEVYLASTRAYQDRDIDTMMEYVTDAFSWYNIMPDGAAQLANSKEQAKQGMKMVFDNIDYVSGHVDFAKTFGNILIAVETDTIRQDGEEVIMRRMSVYECEDGKLNRCWSFPIQDEDGENS
jgi:hypothetical protein